MTESLDLSRLTSVLSRILHQHHKGALFICGLSGAQGAGKSTLAAALRDALEKDGLSCLILALDDFYLPKVARRQLADTVHPLCMTRGVPGTHDVARLSQVLADFKNSKAVRLPRFDKTSDERAPLKAEAVITAPPDIILLEGWCVGAQPAMILGEAETAWEASHDPQAVWKNWSRQAANHYKSIWSACDILVQLRQQRFDEVIDARWLQEQGNAARSGRWQFETRAAVADFCAHYESWTKALWRDLPAKADIVIDRAPDFSYRIHKPANTA